MRMSYYLLKALLIDNQVSWFHLYFLSYAMK